MDELCCGQDFHTNSEMMKSGVAIKTSKLAKARVLMHQTERHVDTHIAWDENSLILVACVDNVRKPNTAGKLRWSGDTVTLTMSGCGEYRSSSMGNGKDYWNALRLYALYMKDEHGLASRKSPSWALKPWWSTYHHKESFTYADINRSVPTLFQQLGIKNVQIDSGGWGQYGWGMDTRTVNRKTLVSVNKFKQFNKALKSEGLRTIV